MPVASYWSSKAMRSLPVQSSTVYTTSALPCVQGLTLVQLSAQLKRIMWDRGAIRGCLGGV